MEPKEFETLLQQITKPKVGNLKHQDMLANAITSAKDKSALSWWCLCIPLYIIAMFVMKSFYDPRRSLLANLHEQMMKEKYSSIIAFIIVPIVFIAINLGSIRKVYFLSGNPATHHLLRLVWHNVLVILLALFAISIYLL